MMGFLYRLIVVIVLLWPIHSLAAVTATITTPFECDDTTDDCLAPKAIFFSGRTSSCDTPECDDDVLGSDEHFHTLRYKWTFGDPNAGTWNTTGEDKNIEYGPITVHVFDPEATGQAKNHDCGDGANTCWEYTVTLEVWSGDAYQSTTDKVYIEDGDELIADETICIANDSLPVAGSGDGCPTGATVRQGSGDFDADMAYALGTNCTGSTECRRILFKGGDTFTASSASSLAGETGPGIVGTYDSTYPPTTKAIIDTGTGNVDVWTSSSVVEDWRIMDLDIRQDSQGAGNGANFVYFARWTDVLIYRIKREEGDVFFMGGLSAAGGPCDGAGHGTGPDDYGCPGTHLIENDIAMTFYDHNALFYAAIESGLIGNEIMQSGCSDHPVRLAGRGQWKDMVISHNDSGGGGAHADCSTAGIKQDWTIRGHDTASYVSQYLVFRRNIFRNDSTNYGLQITPGSGVWDARLEHLIFEGNQFAIGDQEVDIGARYVTVRNNLFDVGNNGRGSLAPAYRSGGALPDGWIEDIYVYNNSFANNRSGQAVVRYNTDASTQTVVNLNLYNNINYGDNTATLDLEHGGFPAGSTLFDGFCETDLDRCEVDDADTDDPDCTDGATNPENCVPANFADPSFGSSPYAGTSPADPLIPAEFYLTGAGAATAIDAGVDLGSHVYDDFEHGVRNDGSYDMGALEFGEALVPGITGGSITGGSLQ
jgi:hypothetical protein